MNNNLTVEITKNQIRPDLPLFKAGDTVSVGLTIKEGNKERIQFFEGVVLKIQGSEINKSFTVRKISAGNISVERTFPFNLPLISSIKVLKIGRVRRAKLYYMRDRIGKAAKIKELKNIKVDKIKKVRKSKTVNTSTKEN